MADTCRWICQEWTISTLPPLPTAHCAECWSEVPGPRGLGWEGLRHLRARWDEWGSSQGCSHRRMYWGDSRGKLGSFCLSLRTPDSFIQPPSPFPSVSSFSAIHTFPLLPHSTPFFIFFTKPHHLLHKALCYLTGQVPMATDGFCLHDAHHPPFSMPTNFQPMKL